MSLKQYNKKIDTFISSESRGGDGRGGGHILFEINLKNVLLAFCYYYRYTFLSPVALTISFLKMKQQVREKIRLNSFFFVFVFIFFSYFNEASSINVVVVVELLNF
jgi:hypothetical protein